MKISGYIFTVAIDRGDAWLNAVDSQSYKLVCHKECAWNHEWLLPTSDVTDICPILPGYAIDIRCQICEKLLTEKVYYFFQASPLHLEERRENVTTETKTKLG